jgi:YbbR domain-containing protein
MWVAITGEAHTLRDVALPLELQFGADLTSSKPPPTAVTVRLEGPETVLRRLDMLRLALRVDLGESPPGPRDVQFSRAHLVGLPEELRVAFFSPDRISLAVESRLRRELPVEPTLSGRPPEGYEVYATQVRPPSVTVEGPASVLRGVTRIATDPLPLGERTRTFSESVWAVPDRPMVRVVAPSERIEVRVIVDRAPVDLTFEGVGVALRGAGATAYADPPAARVTISGPPALVERLDRSHIRVLADVARPGTPRGTRVPIQGSLIDLAPDELARLRVKAVDPPAVALRFQPGGAS